MREKLNRYLLQICAVLLGLMVLAATWQVASRYVFNHPSSFTDELLRYMLIWLTFLGAPLAYGMNKQMAVTFLTDKFSEKGKVFVDFFVVIMMILFGAVVLFIGGIMVTNNAIWQTSPSLHLNMAIVYVSIPLSGVLFTLYAVDEFRTLMKRKNSVKKEEV
ncbi:MAG: TRAP transporter small permease [Mycoplasmatales bacterium]